MSGDATPPPAVSPLLTRLTSALADRYTLEREIGEGGMATVFLATDARHERRVAIKVLHPELSAMLGPERFLSEIKLTASLQHPHILPLFDSGVADGFLYYVMPFVEGETLRRRLDRERQLPVADAVRLATEISDALEYAHTRGIVHRDVKPENVLLQSGRAVVADFGIALAVQHAGGTRMTQTGLSLGTPQYMAPEQAMGERNIDARADIYALGAMTYEMLAGEPPFSGPTAQAIVARVMTERARPLRTVRDTVPESVEVAVATALEKLPADRFASAALFSQALSAPTTSRATRLHASGGVSVGAARVSWRRLAPIAAVAALAGTVIGGGAVWRMRAPDSAALQLPVHFAVTSPDSVRIRLVCCGHMFAISDDGRWLAFQGSGTTDSSRGIQWGLYLRDLTELSTRRLPGTANATSMFFSPRGNELGYVADQKLWRLVLTGSEPQLIAAVPDGFVGGGTWSDDGDITLAVSGRMLHVSASGGALAPLFAPDTTGLQFGGPQRWSNEEVLLYSAASFTQTPQIVWRSLATGGASHVVADGATPHYVPGQRALIFVRDDGAIMRYPFNLATGDTTGPGVILANSVLRRSPVLLHAEYAISATGTLVLPERRENRETRGLSFVDLRRDEAATKTAVADFPAIFRLGFTPSVTRLLVVAGPTGNEVGAYVYDVERGSTTRLPVDGRLTATGMTRDGDSLIFSTGQNQLFIRAMDGSGAQVPLLRLTDWTPSVTISAWGPWIVFPGRTGGAGGLRHIGVAHRDSMGRVRPLSTVPHEENAPAISPDGKWLAFTSLEDGREQVLVTAFPIPGGRFPVSTNGGAWPSWRRDSRTIYFQQNNRIMAADFDGAPTPRLGIPRQIYQRDPWGAAAVASDGQHLVFSDLVREGEIAALTVKMNALSGK